nr:serotonin N-acetyltransferase 2, chloroplastic [Ipomoea trifida]
MLLYNTIISPRHLHTHFTLKPTTHRHYKTRLAVVAQQQQLAGAGAGKFSISDEELQSRGFNLHTSFTDLNLDHLNSVFAAVGFPRRDTAKIQVALEHTDALLWVEHQKAKRPVAFARATGDGVFNAIIWDVVVDPSFQGIGLGKAVMERIVTTLLEKGITNIALYSEPRVLGFYRSLGFVADPDGITGMVYSRKQKKKRIENKKALTLDSSSPVGKYNDDETGILCILIKLPMPSCLFFLVVAISFRSNAIA